MNAMASILLMAFAVNSVQVRLKWAKPDMQGQQLGVCRAKITDVNVAGETLRLTYSVTNVSPNDICVCEDAAVRWNPTPPPKGLDWKRHEPERDPNDPRDVETQILDDTLWIRLRGCRKSDASYISCMEPWVQYRKLGPGQSSSGTIVCSLPVHYSSRFHAFETVVGRRQPVRASRVLLEIGFLPEYRAAVDQRSRKTCAPPMSVPGDPNAICLHEFHHAMWRGKWVFASVDNVSIPCIAIIDDEPKAERKLPKVSPGQ